MDLTVNEVNADVMDRANPDHRLARFASVNLPRPDEAGAKRGDGGVILLPHLALPAGALASR